MRIVEERDSWGLYPEYPIKITDDEGNFRFSGTVENIDELFIRFDVLSTILNGKIERKIEENKEE